MTTPTPEQKKLLHLGAACAFAMALAGCRSDPDPDPPIPDFVSPEGRQVLNDAWAELAKCQDLQALLIFAEIINLADPLGYAAGMAGQSAGQGKPDLPVDNTFQGVQAISDSCCKSIDKIISYHSSTYVMDARLAGRISREEDRFWRRLSLAVGEHGNRCRLPERLDGDLSWPSG